MVICSIYREWVAPTGVEGAVPVRFTSRDSVSLAVVTTQGLALYAIVGEAPERKPSLQQQFSVRLFGTVTSVEAVQYGDVENECLAVTFTDAKVAILAYDSERDSVMTVAICSFEDETLRKGRMSRSFVPEIRVEPTHACAVINVFADQIAVLPMKTVELDDLDDEEDDEPIYGVPKSFVLEANDISPEICNIRDMVFLHGYYGPTLAILYEPQPTAIGRLAAARDTCCLAAVSLDLTMHSQPTVIWTIENLPFDCRYMVPLAKPVGGLLLATTNSLIHVNQPSSVLAVLLNKYATLHGSYEFGRPQHSDHVNITLDGSRMVPIDSHRVLLTLRDGDAYVVHISTDSGVVTHLGFERGTTLCPPTCAALISNSLLFIGSRLADSLLVLVPEQPSADTAPAAKRSRPLYLDTDDLYDLDMLADGDEQARAGAASLYTLEVCDRLPNIGPISDAVAGDLLTDENQLYDVDTRPLQMVTCSGMNASGALHILARQLYPAVFSADSLPDARRVWALAATSASSATIAHVSRPTRCVLVSFDEETMVLESREQLMELEECGFDRDQATVYACSFMGRFVQVTPRSIRVVNNDLALVQELSITAADGVTAAQCASTGPFLLIRLSDGFVRIAEDRHGSLVWLDLPASFAASPVTCLDAYEDLHGMFIARPKEAVAAKSRSQRSRHPAASAGAAHRVAWVDDEEAWDDIDRILYGEDEGDKQASDKPSERSSKRAKRAANAASKATATPTYWCVAGRPTGQLEIFSLPSLELVHQSRGAASGEALLVDSGEEQPGREVRSETDVDPGAAPATDKMTASEVLAEVKLVALGAPLTPTVYLFARNLEGDMHVFRMFAPSLPAETSTRLAVRFSRVFLQLVTRDAQAQNCQTAGGVQLFCPFDKINDHAGVFICGSRPMFVFQTAHCGLRVHPLHSTAPVWSFSSFRRPARAAGFVCLDGNDMFRVCQLPNVLLETAWPARRVPLGRTPYFVAYSHDHLHYIVATSTKTQFVKPLLPDAEKPASDSTGTEDTDAETTDASRKQELLPELHRFSVELLSPENSWTTLDKVELQQYERVLSFKMLHLNSQLSPTGKKAYLCIGTGMLRSENIIAHGRVIVLDIASVVGNAETGDMSLKLKVIFEKEYKSPVSCVAEVSGHLALSVGQQIYVHNFKDGEHTPIAFLDHQVFATQMIGIKDYMLIGDFTKSVWFTRLRELPYPGLDVLSRDARPLRVTAAEFFIDGESLYFAVADEEHNIHLLTYAPQLVESVNGQRLVHHADFHIGSHVQKMLRMPLPRTEARPLVQHIVVLMTSDGAIGGVVPLSERRFRRLQLLQRKLNGAVQRVGGLNARGFRLARRSRAVPRNRSKNLLDAELLWEFVSLSAHRQRELAHQIGSTVQQILDDLQEIEQATALF